MNHTELDAIRSLQKSFRQILRTRLTYPKVTVGLARERLLTSEEISKIYQCIDECLLLTEAQFTSFLSQWEKPA